MLPITHVFLDLDHTLWDFDKNSYLTLEGLYEELDLTRKTDIPFDVFFAMYQKVNAGLWKAYNNSIISQGELRSTRFIRVFEALNREISPQMNAFLSEEYIQRCTRVGHLIEGAEKLLQYLQGKYTYHIITNGFNDSQWTKIQHSNLRHYFEQEQVTTSEKAGAHKPSRIIFDHVCKKYVVYPEQCIMIGDNLDTDILGAKQASIKSVWLAPPEAEKNALPDIQIHHLKEIIDFL